MAEETHPKQGAGPVTSRRFRLRPQGSAGAALALTLLCALFYAPLLLGVRTFPAGDFTDHFLPFSLFQWNSLASLHAPLWNPYTYAGHPFWADIQAAVLYPVSNALLLLTLPFDGAAARLYLLQVEAVIQVAAAGFFVFLLVRQLARDFWGAQAAAICFMLSGYLTGYAPLQLAVLRTAIWLPLLLWLLLRAWERPRQWRNWIGAALVLATSFMGGHAQTFLYAAYATAGWMATLWLGSWLGAQGANVAQTNRHLGRARLLGAAVFVGLASGLAAAQLLPSLEFARLSVRAAVDYAYVSGGFARQDTWNLMLPGVLTHFSPLYIGVVGIGLAALGAISGWVQSSRDGEIGAGHLAEPARFGRAFFGLTALLGLLAAYGDNAFLFPLLYRFAPGWDMFRGQERAAYLVALGLSVLAGYGVAALPRVPHLFRRRYALVYGAAITAGVYAFGLLWQLPGRSAVNHAHYLWIAFATLILAMALALAIWLDGWSTRRAWLLCGLAALNLFIANFATNLDAGGPAAKVTLDPEVAALQAAVAESAGAANGLQGRAYNEFRVTEDYGMRSGVEDVWGSSPLRLAHYAALFDQFPLDRMWRLTGVGHVLTWRRALFAPSTLLGEFPQGEDTTYVHRLPQANPRAWLAPNVIVANDEQAWASLADHGFDLNATAILPPETGAKDTGAGTVVPAGGGEVRLTRLQPERLLVDIKGSSGGLLVVSENWMPGWRVQHASCAGAEGCVLEGMSPAGVAWLTPLRADLAFVGVAAPAGDVRFELAYAPNSVRVGSIISAACVILLLLAATVRLWQRRSRAASHPGRG